MPGPATKPIRRAEIERIVRSVLAEMSTGSQARHEPGDGVLQVHTSVVSLRDLQNQLEGVSRLVVPRGAVITPAARDELRQREISIASHVDRSAGRTGRLAIGRTEVTCDLARLADTLARDGYEVEQMSDAGLMDAVDALCTQVTGEQQTGLLLTSRPAAAACLANRSFGVRAAMANCTKSARDAATSLAANLLVVEPSHRGVFELRQIVQAWQAGRQNCSPELQARLG